MTWIALIVVFVVLAALMTQIAAKRWWEFLIVFGLAGLLIVPFFQITGDVSAIIPGVWNEGLDGKDQIIWVSIVATFMWPVFTAELVVLAVKKVIRKRNYGRTQ